MRDKERRARHLPPSWTVATTPATSYTSRACSSSCEAGPNCLASTWANT